MLTDHDNLTLEVINLKEWKAKILKAMTSKKTGIKELEKKIWRFTKEYKNPREYHMALVDT